MNIDKVKNILIEIGINAKEKSAGLNFRCIICGDSKVSTKKIRGWILSKDNHFNYFCHNCGYSKSFKEFLRENFKNVYLKYFNEFKKTHSHEYNKKSEIKELALDNNSNLVTKDLTDILKTYTFSIIKKQKSITLENLRIRALKYLLQRKIPVDRIKEIYVGINTQNKQYNFKNRIIIPYYYNNIIYAFQARSLNDKEEPKYLTIKEENKIKIYNYFSVDKNDTVFILEGPIDSFFLKNSIATSGTISTDSFNSELIKRTFSKRIWIFDNPGVDKAGAKKLKDFLKIGETCFIWKQVPEWKKFKDFNDVVINRNITSEQIKKTVIENSMSGLRGNIFLKLFS